MSFKGSFSVWKHRVPFSVSNRSRTEVKPNFSPILNANDPGTLAFNPSHAIRRASEELFVPVELRMPTHDVDIPVLDAR